ncbi:MAG: TIGR03016 family PEP-CTERM system-associated outer membrane protein [Aquabacterium sp.]|nr:MAG: TIGR03016 family PEP-CTERM system-associated outer membrane protein [Aquabacterium sp.]
MKRWHRWCCGAAVAALGPVWAQSDAPQQASLWVEPRVGLRVTATDNARLQAGQQQGEQTFEVTPGVRVVANQARVKGFFDYNLSGLYRMQDTGGDNLQHRLNTSAQINAIDNWAYVDVAGTVSQQLISAFGPVAGSSTTNANQAQTTTYRVSPYVRGQFPHNVNYEARYNVQGTKAKSSAQGDSDTQGWSGRLSRQVGSAGLSLSADQQEIDYESGRKAESRTVTGRLSYAWSPQWITGLSIGQETNDLLTPDNSKKTYSNYGVDLTWRPSDRTTLSAGLSDRYFGTGHNLSLSHRAARVLVQVSDVRDVSTSPNASVDATLGTVFSLFDALYQTAIPDDVERAQFVLALLEKNGVPADYLVSQSFLVSQATLQRRQQLSVLMTARRGTFTVSYARGQSSRLLNNLTLGDDFDSTSRIKTDTLSFLYAHRLTPVTSANASYAIQRSEGDLDTQRNSQYTLTLGISTQLGRRTSGSVQVRRLHSTSGLNPYSENALVGNILHRF